MSRTHFFSVLAGALVLASSVHAANPVGRRKAILQKEHGGDDVSLPKWKQGSKPGRRVQVDVAPGEPLSGDGIAPAITAAPGPGVDLAPIGGSAKAGQVDFYPVDQPADGGSSTVICFTQEMLQLYLDWLGMDLGTALHYGLLEDHRLISMFFGDFQRRTSKKPAGGRSLPVDIQPVH